MSENGKLPDLKSLGLEEDPLGLAAEDRADAAREDALLASGKEEEKERKKKFILGGAVGVAAVAALVVGLIFMNPFGGDQNVGDTPDGVVTQVEGEELGPGETKDTTRVVGADEFWREEGRAYPVSLKDWQLMAWNDPRNDASQVENYTYGIPGMSTGLQNLPSRKTGFTDDTSKALLEDGTLNPLYSYWVEEGYNAKVGNALQRFVNPVFGGWQGYQYPGVQAYANEPNTLRAAFADIFDPAYVEAVGGEHVRHWLPLYADWDGNDYGMKGTLLEDGTRWMGVIDGVSQAFTYDEGKQAYTVDVTAQVTYHSWTLDQVKVTKKGVVTMSVKQGPEDNRYLISNAKLEITE